MAMDKVFKGLGSSNHCEDERQAEDFYATDPENLRMLLARETFSKDIWEPACGEGHLGKVLEEYGHTVRATDIVDRGYGTVQDFLTTNEVWDGDIITNPPYMQVDKFIKKSLETVSEGHKVAMILKLLTLEGQKRYKEIYKENRPKYVYVYSKRTSCWKDGIPTKVGAICYCWYIWEKGYKGETILRFMDDEIVDGENLTAKGQD